MTEIMVRPATVDDMSAVTDITNYYISNSTCTMKECEETTKERIRLFKRNAGKYPTIVAEYGNVVIGWASLSEFSERSAYRFTVHDSIYVRQDMRRQGIGTMLMTELIHQASELGYHSIVAVIGSEQVASLSLHKSLGFKEVAHFREVGYKFGRWIDMDQLQLMI